MTATNKLNLSFDPLRQQLLAAAEAFATDAQPLSKLLGALVNDVERAMKEPLEIFPVCHHSPASAVHLIQRLRQKAPRVIFMEMCEDFRPLCEKFRDCKLPVAFQAFAESSTSFPPAWMPLSVVAPFTEFSAEFQAIIFALENAETELVFVDRSVDHVFQWMPQKDDELDKHLGEEMPDDESPESSETETKPAVAHGAALGVQLGDIEPTFDQFREFLVKNAQVRHFREWWEQYVEQAVIDRDTTTYRQVFCLVGSLLRRLGIKDEDRKADEKREQFMWTRMKDYLKTHKIAPSDAIYICGAVHAVSDVEEFGTHTDKRWDVPAPTPTKWLYGMIPSSHTAIDAQFHFPPGTVTLSEASWQKSQKALDVQPFKLKTKESEKAKKPKVELATPVRESTPLMEFLQRAPELGVADEEQLLNWSVGIVELARDNGYLSSTADSIAIFHTSKLLASLRNRAYPSAYDFRDAAITCLEKDRTPKKRNISRLCEVMLGGDRIGQVGYDSLPPLAQDVYTRLAPLKLNLKATSIQRALIDLRANKDLLPCSDLLWKIRYLLRDNSVRPIMGERKLGHVPTQESWDISFGKSQTSLIMLGYEGVTVEHVLERRLKAKAFASEANPAIALQAAEDSILFLKSQRLTEEIGERAIQLLGLETGAQSAPEIFERVRGLVHYSRSTPTGLPEWLKRFVTTGYSHYSTLLPNSFADRGTTPDQVAGMLSFLFTLESLALSLGCQRSQLLIAVQQAGPVTDDPNKIGLLWAAEWLLGLRTIDAIREFFNQMLANPMALTAFPSYVNGFLLALKFTPLVARLVVELLSRAFGVLPDRILFPWLPGLLMTLRPHAEALMPSLLKEASSCFPQKLADLAKWEAPWDRVLPEPKAKAKVAEKSAGVSVERSPQAAIVHGLLRAHPASVDGLAQLLGAEGSWAEESGTASVLETGASLELSGNEGVIAKLLTQYPATTAAMAELLG